MRFVRRGVGEAVAATIAISIIAIVLLYIVLSLPKPVAVQQRSQISFFNAFQNENLWLYPGEETLNVVNIGSTIANITNLVIYDTISRRLVVANARSSSCTIQKSVLSPGEMTTINCGSNNYVVIAVVTSLGKVFAIDKTYEMLISRVIHVIPIYSGVTITNTLNVVRFLENPNILFSGAINTSVQLTPLQQSSGSVNAILNGVYLVIVGTNPLNNKTNILIVGRGVSGDSLKIGESTINIAQRGYLRYRIKLENCSTKPIINGKVVDMGINMTFASRDPPLRLTFSDACDRIAIYTNTTKPSSGVVGLDPYIFVGDINGNGNSEFILVTQDFDYGDSSVVNDRLYIGGRTYNYVESTIQPVRLVFTNVPIDSSKYSVAILTARIFFWDNDNYAGNAPDSSNSVVIRVGLYDNDTKSFAYSVYLSYYELSRYRNVYPFSVSYITKDFVLYIPNTGKRYYIALEIYDPYYMDRTMDDLDIIVGVEYIGIAVAPR
jgi:hypothetical protein